MHDLDKISAWGLVSSVVTFVLFAAKGLSIGGDSCNSDWLLADIVVLLNLIALSVCTFIMTRQHIPKATAGPPHPGYDLDDEGPPAYVSPDEDPSVSLVDPPTRVRVQTMVPRSQTTRVGDPTVVPVVRSPASADLSVVPRGQTVVPRGPSEQIV